MAAKKALKKPAKSGLSCVRVELAITCGRCMRPVVIERVAESVTCRACLHTRPLAPSDWRNMAASSVAEGAKEARDPHRLRTDFGEEYTVRSRVGVAEATCAACGVTMTAESLAAGVASEAVTCACGATMFVRAADHRVRAIAPNAVAIANERAEAPVSAPTIAFRCVCGSSLRADGTARCVSCVKCGAVDVPEALWNTLRPIRPRAPMFLVVGKG